MKIAWRNWGRQLRVLPPPNFMSARYREACNEEMRILIPLILRWWGQLPEDKRHLLIGIKLGWESAIGVNSFYYPNGNALLDLSEDKDPQTRTRGAIQGPDRGVERIGYAAVIILSYLADRATDGEGLPCPTQSDHINHLCARSAGSGAPAKSCS